MTNFDESKLSKILARKIVGAEDSSPLLDLATPIYCPDNNGVKANRVTIINPNKQYITQTSITVDGDVELHFPRLTNDNITLNTFSVHGINIQYGHAYETTYSENNGQAIASERARMTIFYGMQYPTNFSEVTIYPTRTSNYGNNNNIRIAGLNLTPEILETIKNGTADGATIGTTLYEGGSWDSTQNLVINIDNKEKFDCLVISGQGSSNGNRFHLRYVDIKGTYIGKNQKNIDIIGGNTNDEIELTEQSTYTITIPHEVDLKSNIDLINLLKAEAALNFKNDVSKEILVDIGLNITSGIITTDKDISLESTMGKTIANCLTEYIDQGSGARFGIVKYDNGAPVPYVESQPQPNIDRIILNKPEDTDCCEMIGNFEYGCIDDIQIPATHLCVNPTLLIDKMKYNQLLTELADGDTKKDIADKITTNIVKQDLNDIGEGIFGDNSCYAVAFTEPKVTRSPNQNLFGDDLTITIFYGIKLINPKNLFIVK